MRVPPERPFADRQTRHRLHGVADVAVRGVCYNIRHYMFEYLSRDGWAHVAVPEDEEYTQAICYGQLSTIPFRGN